MTSFYINVVQRSVIRSHSPHCIVFYIKLPFEVVCRVVMSQKWNYDYLLM